MSPRPQAKPKMMPFSPRVIAWLALFSSASVLANPVNAKCKAVSKDVNVLRAAPLATSFCSSFLHISTTTKTGRTVTITPTVSTTVGSDQSTVTITAPAQFTTTVTVSTSSCPSTTTIVARMAEPEAHRQRPPPPIPSCIKGKASSAVSKLCSCLNIPTPTSTITATITAPATTVTVTTPIGHTTTITPTSTSTSYICGCTAVPGFNVAFWEGDFPDDGDAQWPEFRPEYFKNVAPAASTRQTDTDYLSRGQPVSYNGGESSIQQFGLNTPPTERLVTSITAYFRAPYSDVFTFAFPEHPNDIGFVWTGALAYAGWNRDNAVQLDTFSAGCTNANSNGCQFDIPLNAGEYFPIRIMFGNRGSSGTFFYAIYDSIGRDIITDVELQSCDGIAAPQFLEWGSEL